MSRRFQGVPDLVWMAGVTALAWAVRVIDMGRQSLWFDEAFNWLVVAGTDLQTGWQIALSNFVHPPLYYLIGRLFASIGDGEWLLRLPALLAGTAGIPVIYVMGKQVGGRHVGLLAAVLLAVNPFHVWFSREARNYSLAMLLALFMVLFFLRLLRGQRVWLWFTVFSGLAFITHYFCLLIPLAQFGYFLLNFRRRYRLFRSWVFSMGVAFLPMLVWLMALFNQEQKMIGIGWIPTPRLWTPLVTLWNFCVLTIGKCTALEAVALPLFALALLLGVRNSRHRQWLLLWLATPLVAVMLVSWAIGRNFYVDRYFIISLPAYLLLLAGGTSRLYARWGRVGLSIALVVASVAGTMRIFADPRLAKEDWRGAAAILAENRQPDDLVVLRNAEDIIPLTYYQPGLDPWTFLNPRPEADPWSTILRDYSPDRIWLVYVNPAGSNHLLTKGVPFDIYASADPATRVWLAQDGRKKVSEYALPGVTVIGVELSQ